MNKRISIEMVVIIILLVVISLGIGFWLGNGGAGNFPKQSNNSTGKADNGDDKNISSNGDSISALPSESQATKKVCGQEKIICPDGVLVSRMDNPECSFPYCAKGRYDFSDDTYKVYQNEKYAIEFKYPSAFTTSEFAEHDNTYGGDLVVELKRFSSSSNQETLKLYFSKDLSKYPDLAKTVARIRKDTGFGVEEKHIFGFPGAEGYDVVTYSDSKKIKWEGYEFIKLDDGFYYFKDDLAETIKNTTSHMYGIISTLRSINY